MRAAASAAAQEAIQVALGPIQQSFAFLQQREQERALPPIQKGPFAATYEALRQLPDSAQDSLQPFYLALRAADTVDSDQQAVAALEPLTRFCLDHPAATAQDLKQQVQLLSASNQVNPFLGLLTGNQGNLIQLLQGAANSQPAQAPVTSAATTCYKCGRQGHFGSACPHALDINGQPVAPGQLKFAPASWRNNFGFGPDGRKRQ